MQTQSQSQHARPEAHVVVNPVGWTTVVMQSRHMGAYPDSKIRRHIHVSRICIWLVLIDRRSPVNGDATQNETKKDRQIQPVSPAHQEMVLPDDEHARLFRQRARRVRFTVGGVEWLIDRNPYCLVSGDAAGMKRNILSVTSVPFGSFSVAA